MPAVLASFRHALARLWPALVVPALVVWGLCEPAVGARLAPWAPGAVPWLLGAALALALRFGRTRAVWTLALIVLTWLLAREGSASQARIAELLEIEPISVSRLVDRMEQAGWVERGSDPNDRRVRLLQPSQKAIDAFEEVRLIAGEIYDRALEGLDAGERALLTRGLETVVANLGRMELDDAADAAARKGAAE